jgi:hypothetical protein
MKQCFPAAIAAVGADTSKQLPRRHSLAHDSTEQGGPNTHVLKPAPPTIVPEPHNGFRQSNDTDFKSSPGNALDDSGIV